MVYTLSPSKLNVFNDCPRCFYLEQNLGIKRPRGPFPSLPSGMDRVLKEQFKRHQQKDELPGVLSDLEDVVLYTDPEQLSVWQNNFKGISVTDDDGNVIRGAIDNLLIDADGKLVILDYKTRGFPLKEDTANHYQTQLDIYSYLFEQNGYDVASYGYLLFYYPLSFVSSDSAEFAIERVTMNISSERGSQVIHDALEVLYSELIPYRADDCEYCAFLEKGSKVLH